MQAFLRCEPAKTLVILIILLTFMPTAVGVGYVIPPVVEDSPGQEEPARQEPDRRDLPAAPVSPVEVAQQPASSASATTLLTEEQMSEIKGAQSDSASLLAEADSLWNAGETVGAWEACIDLIGTYPRSSEAPTARGIAREALLDMAATGEMHMGYIDVADRNADEEGVVPYDTYRGVTQELIWQLMMELSPDSALQVSLVRAYHMAAAKFSLEQAETARAALEALINENGPSLMTWSARAVVAASLITIDGNLQGGSAHLVSMLQELDGFASEALLDPEVSDSVKAEIEYLIGYARLGAGNASGALVQFEHVLQSHPAFSEGRYRAGYASTLLSMVDPPDPLITLSAFHQYVDGLMLNAQGMLAVADVYRAAPGYGVDTWETYIDLIGLYPDSPEADTATDGASQILQEIAATGNGELYDGVVAAYMALADKNRYPSQVRDAYYLTVRDTVLGLMKEIPNSPIQVSLVRACPTAARERSPDDEIAVTRAFEEMIRENEPSLMTWTARVLVADDLMKREWAPGESMLHFASMLEEMQSGFVDDVLNDAGVSDDVKAEINYITGYALLNKDMNRAALHHFDLALDLYPDPSPVTFLAGLAKGVAIDRVHWHEPAVRIAAYQEHIDQYPDSPYAAAALRRIGRVYLLTEDYSSAASVYRDVIQTYPDSIDATIAEENLYHLTTHHWSRMDSGALAALGELKQGNLKKQLAQMCGPSALQKLLEIKGVKSTVEELAKLAGTDETGTTMLGLIKAAKAKGVELVAPETNQPKDLPVPFIAYVSGNHFVLVKEVNGDSLAISDMGKPAATVSLADFRKTWDGKALVCGKTEGFAKLLDVAALKGAKGGCDLVPGDVFPYCKNLHPTSCTTICCYNGGGGDGAPGSGDDGEKSYPTDGPPSGTAGAQTGPPKQSSWSGIDAPGVHVKINNFQSSVQVDETDTRISTVGPLTLRLSRNYVNPYGYHRGQFVETNRPWRNNIGRSWTHNLNMHLRVSSLRGTVVLFNPKGIALDYTRISTSGGYDTYERGGYYDTDNDGENDDYKKGTTWERGITLQRDQSTGKFTMKIPGGAQYGFSAETDDDDRYSRMEWIKDVSDNQMDFEYDGAVGTGKLTKVTTPSSDNRYMQFYYDGNLITMLRVMRPGVGGIKDEVKYEYDSDNFLTKVTDNASNSVQYEYGYAINGVLTSRYITKITDKASNVTDFDWEHSDHETWGWHASTITVNNAGGLSTTYERNRDTGVSTVENWDGATRLNKMRYTPADYYLWRLGKSDYYVDNTSFYRWVYEYDADDDLTKVKRPDGLYHGDSDVVSLMAYTYTDKGRTSTKQLGNNNATTWEYESSDSLYPTKRTGPDGRDMEFTYDSSDRIVTVKYPWNGTSDGVIYTYDSNGQVITKTDPLGNSSTYEYNYRGNMTSMKDPLGKETKMEHDSLGNVTKVTDPRNKSTEYYHYTGGCGCGGGASLSMVKDPLGKETKFEYDDNGNMTKVTDALGRATDYTYDVMNRFITADPPGSGPTMTFSYDKLGRMTSRTDFEGKTTSYEHDHMGRATKITDPVDYVQFAYDGPGNMTKVTDCNGNATDYEYDDEQRLTKVTDAESNVVKYVYDSGGRLVTKGAGASGTTDPIYYTYDSTTGLLSKVEYHNGANTNYACPEFDVAGRLTKITDDFFGSEDSLQYAYDDANRLTQLTEYDDSTLDLTYDDAGNVITMDDYHSNDIIYTYTDRNQVSTITAPGTDKTWTFTYNDLGQRITVSVPNSMNKFYDYDERNRLTRISQRDSSDAMTDSFKYHLDGIGNITKTVNYGGSHWDYEYDGRYRLTKAERDNSSDTLLHRYTYVYDDGDNMVTKEIYDAGTEETATYLHEYNDANELTKQTLGETDTLFFYDSWGRMISKDQGAYGADYEYRYGDKLKSVTSNFPNEANVTYKYGGDGKRRERSSPYAAYKWDAGWNMINKENSLGGTLSVTYVYDPGAAVGNILAHISGSDPATGTYRYYLNDIIGSVRRVRTQSETSLTYYEYTPYGEVYQHYGNNMRYRFAGKEWDDNAQMYYFPYRYYSPGIARWISREPTGVDGPNLYWYAHVNPVSTYDPDGRLPTIVTGLLGLVGGGIGGCITNSIITALGNLFGGPSVNRPVGCSCLGGLITGGLEGAVVGLTAGAGNTYGLASALGSFVTCWCEHGWNNAECCIGPTLFGALMGYGYGQAFVGAHPNIDPNALAPAAGVLTDVGSHSWSSVWGTWSHLVSGNDCCED